VEVYLFEAVRTPFGWHRSGLAGIGTDDLAALPSGQGIATVVYVDA
jgi:hypothetical protein